MLINSNNLNFQGRFRVDGADKFQEACKSGEIEKMEYQAINGALKYAEKITVKKLPEKDEVIASIGLRKNESAKSPASLPFVTLNYKPDPASNRKPVEETIPDKNGYRSPGMNNILICQWIDNVKESVYGPGKITQIIRKIFNSGSKEDPKV